MTQRTRPPQNMTYIKTDRIKPIKCVKLIVTISGMFCQFPKFRWEFLFTTLQPSSVRHSSARERTNIVTPTFLTGLKRSPPWAQFWIKISWRMLSYFELEKFVCFCFVLFVCLFIVFLISLCQCHGNLEILIHLLISSPFNVRDIQDPYELCGSQPLWLLWLNVGFIYRFWSSHRR